MHKLFRFVETQDPVYPQVIRELRNGYKASAWLPFIFPQLYGLENDPENRLFELQSTHEARAYLSHPILGPRLLECTELILHIQRKTILAILGSPDFMRFKASMTLFSYISESGSVFHLVLAKYFSNKMDTQTLQIIKEEMENPTSDHISWLEEYRTANKNADDLSDLRAEIFRETLQISLNGSYQVDHATIMFDPPHEVIKNTVFYSSVPKIQSFAARYETNLIVTKADAIDIAQILIATGCNPAIHISANRQKPGGAVINGADGIEEEIFRRSNICSALYQYTDEADLYDIRRHPEHSYPIHRHTGGIYTPYITIFRSSEINGYCLLKQPHKLSFIHVPALNSPELISVHGEWRIATSLTETIREKVRTILRIAFQGMHDSIILNAFGCDHHKNPPKHVAELIKEVIQEQEFRNIFRMIVFAITDDPEKWREYNPHGNLLPFLTTFS